MTDAALQRVLRSDELPAPAPARTAARLREQATAGTIALPEIREVEVDGQVVLLTRLASGEVVAFDRYCPHQGTDLRRATIFGGNIRCEQHKFVYEPRTGRNLLPSRDASPKALERLKPGVLPTYPVEERDGWIWVAGVPNPPPDESEPLPAEALPPEVAGPADEDDEPTVHAPQSVEVAVGEEFELDLPTRHRPNHLWHVEVDGDAVEITGQRFDEQADGLHYWVRAVASVTGAAQLRCTYAKPWGSDVREQYTIDVHVRDA